MTHTEELKELIRHFVYQNYPNSEEAEKGVQALLSLIEEEKALGVKAIQEKYEKEKKVKPFVHKLLHQTAREAYERHRGFLSGLLVAKDIITNSNKKV